MKQSIAVSLAALLLAGVGARTCGGEAKTEDRSLAEIKRRLAEINGGAAALPKKGDMAAERRFAQTPLASDLLPALDNLDRAVAAASQAGEKGPLVQGVAMVQSQLLDALRRHGVTPIEAQGKQFDPHLHQAVMQQPSEKVPPQTVLQVLEQGYMLHDRVLRPARVIVSMQPA